MYELMGRLQIRDLTKKQLEKELEREEYVYDQVVSSLSKAKQERRHHNSQIQNEKNAKLKEIDAVSHILQKARTQKAQELANLEGLKGEQTELEDEECQLKK